MATNTQKMDTAAVISGWTLDEITPVSRVYEKNGETVTVIMSGDLPTRAVVRSPGQGPAYLRGQGAVLAQAVVDELEA
jgi:hypothetical protein